MSMPTIPDSFGDLTQEQTHNMMMASIAMGELALSHIMNAEAEKIQYILGTLPDKPCECPTTEEILQVNHSVSNVLEKVMNNLLLLKGTLAMALECQNRPCPPNPGPCPTPCPKPQPKPNPKPCPAPCPGPKPNPKPCPRPNPEPCLAPCPKPCPPPEPQPCCVPNPKPQPPCSHKGINIYYAVQNSRCLQWQCEACPNKHIFQKENRSDYIYLASARVYLISYAFYLCVPIPGAVSISVFAVKNKNCREIHASSGYSDDWDSEICISGSIPFATEEGEPTAIFFSLKVPCDTVIDQATVSIAELQ